jgi:hypothetical protein
MLRRPGRPPPRLARRAVNHHPLCSRLSRPWRPWVTDPEHEQFWPGQSRQLYEKLPPGKELIQFTEAEGADSHCEPAGNGIRGERIFDWLDQHVPA